MHRGGRDAVLRRLEGLRRQRLSAGRHRGAQPARRGRDPARQDQHPRVRVPLRLQQPGLRRHPQPAQPRSLRRWIVRRRGRGARDGHLADRRGLGLRRFDPRAGAFQRRHGAQARALGGPLWRALPARAGDVDPAVVRDRADGSLRRRPAAAAADLRETGLHDRSRRRASPCRPAAAGHAARRDLRRGRDLPGRPCDPRGRAQRRPRARGCGPRGGRGAPAEPGRGAGGVREGRAWAR